MKEITIVVGLLMLITYSIVNSGGGGSGAA